MKDQDFLVAIDDARNGIRTIPYAMMFLVHFAFASIMLSSSDNLTGVHKYAVIIFAHLMFWPALFLSVVLIIGSFISIYQAIKRHVNIQNVDDSDIKNAGVIVYEVITVLVWAMVTLFGWLVFMERVFFSYLTG